MLMHPGLLCYSHRQTAVALQAQQTHLPQEVLQTTVPYLNQTQVFQLLHLAEAMALQALPTLQLVMAMEIQAHQSLNPHLTILQVFQAL